MPKALFILKRREDYSQDPSYSGSPQIATGMWNSAKFVVDALNEKNIPADIELVIDANSIDAVCMAHNPDVVFIEGLWVTPAKMTELRGLARHAHRTFVVRVHSEIPFLATEGIAMDWIGQYLKTGVTVAPNAPRSHDHLKAFAEVIGADTSLLPYLPNCFPTDFRAFHPSELDTEEKQTLDVGCFGAYRPLKNHLQQALIAMRFANSLGKKLRFHVNDRKDQGGQPVFKNVQGMFDHLPPDQFELVVHGWEDRDSFLMSLQNIDLIGWVGPKREQPRDFFVTKNWSTDPCCICRDNVKRFTETILHQQAKAQKVLSTIWANKTFQVNQNRSRLRTYANQSQRIWVDFMNSFTV